jgi:hypothetical protein
MAPILSFLISCGFKKKEPRYIRLSEAKASLRLKILMTSGSKNGTQIYCSFLSKVWQTNPLQVPQEGPYREGGPLTGHFAYLSKTSSFGFPSKGALPEAPSTDPLEREMPHPQSPYERRCLSVSGAFSKYLSGSPAREPSLQVSFAEIPQRETLHAQSPFQPSLKVLGRRAPFQVPRRGPYGKKCPTPEPYLSSRVPSKGALPPGSLHRAPIERNAPPPEPLSTISQSPG